LITARRYGRPTACRCSSSEARRTGRSGAIWRVVMGVNVAFAEPGVLAERSVEDRDRPGQRVVQVEEQRVLAGLLADLDSQLVPALRGGVRLGGQQRRLQVGGSPAPAGGQPKGAVGALRLPNSRSYGIRSTFCPSSKPRALAPGPTTGRKARRRFRWPGCNTGPRPWLGRAGSASRCSQRHSPAQGRQNCR
jgi:hypothetical protein